MILEIAEYLGIVAFTVSGFYIARRNNLDVLGVYIVSFLTALGGGVMRDIIIGRPPISFVQYSYISIVVTISTFLLFVRHRYQHDIDSKPFFIFMDAIGMSSFAISGALLAIEQGYAPQGIAILAFTTAIGGGIFRDILINQVPYVIKGGFYGVIALGVGISVYLLNLSGLLNELSIIVLFLVAIVLRLYAYYKNWGLPVI